MNDTDSSSEHSPNSSRVPGTGLSMCLIYFSQYLYVECSIQLRGLNNLTMMTQLESDVAGSWFPHLTPEPVFLT